MNISFFALPSQSGLSAVCRAGRAGSAELCGYWDPAPLFPQAPQ